MPLSAYGIRITVLIGVLIMASASMAAVGALGCARIAACRLPFAPRAAKFALVGTLNTLCELSFITVAFLLLDHAAQIWFPLLKTASFLFASGNAYFWNRTWTFEAGHSPSLREYLIFFGANIIGFLINIGVASFLVNIIGPPAAIAPVTWANIAIIVAVCTAMGFNFLSQREIFRTYARNAHR